MASKADEFTRLWKILPHPNGSVMRVFARKGDHRNGDFARTCAEMRKFAKTHEDWNCYVAPNPTMSTKGLRHSAKDVTHWSYFLIDVDPVHMKACNPTKAMHKALEWMSAWFDINFLPEGPTPPLIIDSGRGMQAWLRLNDVVLTDTERATARRAMGHWLKKLDEYLAMDNGCKIDTSTSDLPRLMRLPGTVNQKTGRTSTLLIPSDVVYTGLAEKLIEGAPREVFVDPPVPSSVVAGQKWQKVFHHLTRMAQDYLMRGQEEPGRHKVMWHTAKKLHEIGVTREEARRALKRANKLKGKDEELPDDQIEHALDTAYTG